MGVWIMDGIFAQRFIAIGTKRKKGLDEQESVAE